MVNMIFFLSRGPYEHLIKFKHPKDVYVLINVKWEKYSSHYIQKCFCQNVLSDNKKGWNSIFNRSNFSIQNQTLFF
jgi:hypothetical protein